MPEHAIAEPMHHLSRQITQRYIHAGQQARERAIAAMPDLTYDRRPTGTGGKK